MRTDCDTCVFRLALVRHRTFLIVCAVGVSMILPHEVPAQLQIKADAAAADTAGQEESADGSGSPAESGVASDSKAVQRNEMVDQINSIRQQMGGGVASQLEGLFDDSEAGRKQLQQEFERRLNELVATPRPAPVVQPALTLMNGAMDHVCVSLRKAARELDSVAADLEDAGLYGEADMIRSSAGNLRSRARAVAPSWAANPAQTSGSASRQSPSAGLSDAPAENSGLSSNAIDPKIRPRQ